jgi:hypothetical protein
MIAQVGLSVKATIINKTFDGKWVNIIVAIAPIFATSLEDTTPLIPPTILQTNNKPPTESN